MTALSLQNSFPHKVWLVSLHSNVLKEVKDFFFDSAGLLTLSGLLLVHSSFVLLIVFGYFVAILLHF